MFWFFTCCNRGDKPKYLKYKPLRDVDGDEDDDDFEGEFGDEGDTARVSDTRTSGPYADDYDEEAADAPLRQGTKSVQMQSRAKPKSKNKSKNKKKGMRR